MGLSFKDNAVCLGRYKTIINSLYEKMVTYADECWLNSV